MEDPSTEALYVIGHRNPDTDAICAAIGAAAFLRADGHPEAVAARCGHINKRTEWVLEQAGVPKPYYLRDVRPTAGSVCTRDVIKVSPQTSFLTTYRLMDAQNVRSIPVVDESEHVVGMLPFMNLLKLLMPPALEEFSQLRYVETNYKSVLEVLEAENLTGQSLSEEDEELIIVVAASSELTLWRRLEQYKQEGQIGRVMLICGDRSEVQTFAVEQGIGSLVLTANVPPRVEVMDLAKKNGTKIFLTKLDTATVGKLIRCSRRVQSVLNDDFVVFEENRRLDEIRPKISRLRQDLYPVVDTSHRIVGVFSKSDLVDPPRVQLVLVDHNEMGQAVSGIEDADVIQIIDHHRLGGSMTSRNPIQFLAEPVGATCTLVARKFFHRNLVPEKNVALCLCAGILSDTINLTSPTTTDLDRDILSKLCKIAEVDPVQFTKDFFAAGSMLKSGEDAAVIINADRKEFEEYDCKMSISQIEEVGLAGFDEARPALEAALKRTLEIRRCDFACLLITDVANYNSLLLVAGDPNVIDELPYPRRDATLFDAPGVVSRKKQLFPDLAATLRRTTRG